MAVTAQLPNPEPEQWGIVELLGHITHGARIGSEQLGGSMLIRLDIPTADGFRTKIIGTAALYALTYTTEAEARNYQARYGTEFRHVLPAPTDNRALLPYDPDDEDDEDYDDPDDVDMFADCHAWDDPPKSPPPAAA